MHVHACSCMHMWLEINAGYLTQSLLILFLILTQGLSLNPELKTQLDWLASEAPGPTCPA